MRDIELTNGERLEIKINFLTIKIINDLKSKNKTENDFDAACKVIYAIMRSNGKMVSEEEALALMPLDSDVIFDVFEEFKKKSEGFKKKQEKPKLTKKK